MTSAPLDPPRLRSERALRQSTGVPLLLGTLTGLVFVGLALGDPTAPGEFPYRPVLAAFYAVMLVLQARRWLRLSAWRTVDLDDGERVLWGTSAARVLPGEGWGHDGLLVLSDRRLRYLPDWSARLRGTAEESWPVTALTAVRVTPVDQRRRRRGGRWVSIEVEGGDGDAVTLLTPEPHLVADELFDALHAQGLLPRPA